MRQDESELNNIFGGNSQLLTLGLGLLATALAATYVTRLAKLASFRQNTQYGIRFHQKTIRNV
ncbi:unnamed protein product, partial [Sphenostylis stenocarpa]